MSHKVELLTYFLQITNFKDHPNDNIGLKVKAFLLESVEQTVRITPHFGNAEIVT